jgi:hypothetical protein
MNTWLPSPFLSNKMTSVEFAMTWQCILFNQETSHTIHEQMVTGTIYGHLITMDQDRWNQLANSRW